jgi:cytochrome c-type biogenesis protein CcmI
MVVTLIGLLIVAAAAIYIAWPLLRQDAHAAMPRAPSEVAAMQKEKEVALEAIRELDFDLRIGKLSEEDHQSLRANLEKRALHALTALDAAGDDASPMRAIAGQGSAPSTDEGGGFCPSCGNRFKRDARFCVSCGKKVTKSESRRDRRHASS